MFRRILIPLDGTERSESVLGQVERILQVTDPEVVLLRVIDPSRPPHLSTQLRAENAREVLRRLCAELRARGVSARPLVEVGDPVEIILAQARYASLVAMGHGPRGWLRGSVTLRVLRRCPAPLFLCGPAAALPSSRRFQRFLVPLDGSSRSAGVLPLVASLAERHDAELIQLRVHQHLPATDLEGWEPTGPRTTCTADHALPVWVGGVRPRAVCVEAQEVADGILGAVERNGIDALAMTTHGRTGILRLLLGSVTEEVLRRSTVPVFVVGAKVPAGAADGSLLTGVSRWG